MVLLERSPIATLIAPGLDRPRAPSRRSGSTARPYERIDTQKDLIDDLSPPALNVVRSMLLARPIDRGSSAAQVAGRRRRAARRRRASAILDGGNDVANDRLPPDATRLLARARSQGPASSACSSTTATPTAGREYQRVLGHS